jgi:pimeloyl-ACP methyl ester carboxylesterase
MTENSETPDASGKRSEMDRRGVLRAAAVAGAVVTVPGVLGMAGTSYAADLPGLKQNAREQTSLPGLPKDFGRTFTSQLVRVGGIRFHAVTGGRGPAVLLIGGWPQTWYAWRHVMSALARDFHVVALDPRGVGLSDKPASGYDSGTLADDAVRVMGALGHGKFALVTHDVGSWTGYALASDHPHAVDRFVAMETITPGLTDPSPFLLPGALNSLLWHYPFNRVTDINEQLVRGREDIYFGYQFATKAATPTSVPREAVKVYVDAIKASPEALRSSFEFYRAIDLIIAQNSERKKTKLTMPVLAVGGERAVNTGVETEMRSVAENVTSVIIPGGGHYLMDENPGQVLNAIQPFLAPYRG